MKFSVRKILDTGFTRIVLSFLGMSLQASVCLWANYLTLTRAQETTWLPPGGGLQGSKGKHSQLLRFLVGRRGFRCLSFFPSLSFFPLSFCFLTKHGLEKITVKGEQSLQSRFSRVLFCSLTFLVCLQLQVYDNGSLWE